MRRRHCKPGARHVLCLCFTQAEQVPRAFNAIDSSALKKGRSQLKSLHYIWKGKGAHKLTAYVVKQTPNGRVKSIALASTSIYTFICPLVKSMHYFYRGYSLQDSLGFRPLMKISNGKPPFFSTKIFFFNECHFMDSLDYDIAAWPHKRAHRILSDKNCLLDQRPSRKDVIRPH